MPPRPPAQPVPTLLTVPDAMMFAAERLDKMAADLELMSLFSEVFAKPRPVDEPRSEETELALAEMRTITSGILDKDLQVRVLKEAAKSIRNQALEEKLLSARHQSVIPRGAI